MGQTFTRIPRINANFHGRDIALRCPGPRGKDAAAQRPYPASVIFGGAYKGLTDYDKLRANSILLASDIKKACAKMRQTAKKFFDPQNPFKKN
jgi:hypothetical protein